MVVTLAEAGGAQTYVASLLPGLRERFEVVVAAHGPGPLRDAAGAAGARFVELRHVRRALSPVRDLRGLVELVRLMRAVRPAIVHTSSSKAGVLGRVAAMLTGVPVRIFTVHGWAFSAYAGLAGRAYLAADRLAARFTTLTICVAESERAAGLRARTCHPDRTVVVHNGVRLDVPRSRHASSGAGGALTILSVGRLRAPKDMLTLVRALGELNPGSFHARIVGDGPERPQLVAEIAQRGLLGRVELLGERADVPELLAEADVFVLSSRSEGLPMSILEAMAAGLPVVASEVGGVGELVVAGETGLLVPPGRPDALAAALRTLLVDASRRERMGAGGRRRAAAHFGLAAAQRAHVELYEAALASHDAL
jgi:glycosyltransferase involved in cell wall biosynthesis